MRVTMVTLSIPATDVKVFDSQLYNSNNFPHWCYWYVSGRIALQHVLNFLELYRMPHLPVIYQGKELLPDFCSHHSRPLSLLALFESEFRLCAELQEIAWQVPELCGQVLWIYMKYRLLLLLLDMLVGMLSDR